MFHIMSQESSNSSKITEKVIYIILCVLKTRILLLAISIYCLFCLRRNRQAISTTFIFDIEYV